MFTVQVLDVGIQNIDMYVYVGSRHLCFAWQLSQQEQFHSRQYGVFQELISGEGRVGEFEYKI